MVRSDTLVRAVLITHDPGRHSAQVLSDAIHAGWTGSQMAVYAASFKHKRPPPPCSSNTSSHYTFGTRTSSSTTLSYQISTFLIFITAMSTSEWSFSLALPLR
jgi:hypothetical protein